MRTHSISYLGGIGLWFRVPPQEASRFHPTFHYERDIYAFHLQNESMHY